MQTFVLTDSIIRPQNATAYAAGDVISEVTTNDHYTFSDAGQQQALNGFIEAASISIQANQSTDPSLELWLFHTDIAEVADNSAFAPSDAELATLIGVIKFEDFNFLTGLSGSAGSGNITQNVQNINLPFRLPVGSYDIYGQLVVRNVYTPANIADEKYTVRLLGYRF